MAKWTWVERTFLFDYPVTKWPDLLERVRGTPARLEDRLRGVSRETLTYKPEGGGWSIQENVGHLIDLGYLPIQRIDQILALEKELIAADMKNQKTNQARHNDRKIQDLLAEFRADRAQLVARFASLSEDDWGKSALHPRIKIAMRIVDIAYFDSEHDDYHLGRIGELLRAARTEITLERDKHMSFWNAHGIFFLIGLTLFPRITVIFFSKVTGLGILFWIAFLIFPRIVIPILAAYHYWDTNPVLVILSFLISLSVETGEKTVVKRKVIHRRPTEFIDV